MEKDKNAHIIYSPFTGVGLHGGFRGNEWLKHRIGIFKKYTLQSMLNQTNKDFIHWLSFRQEEKDNQHIKDLKNYLISIKYPHIFTFNGLMYWDDKFNSYSYKSRIKNFLMMLWDCWIYKEWKNPLTLLKLSWEDKNQTLIIRIMRSLTHLEQVIGKDYDWVYLTRIDSDDMFHQEAVNIIQSQEPEINKALVFDKGYILNVKTGQVAEWNPPTNPPFHTIIFPGDVFFNAQKYLKYYKDFRTHEDIHRVFNCVQLDETLRRYCVAFHGKHISTAWNSPIPRKIVHKVKYGSTEPFRGKEIEPKGYMYTTSGRNISTHWESRTGHVKNFMVGTEFEGETKKEILESFGLKSS